MEKITLRKYLTDLRLQLYEEIDELKNDKILYGILSENEKLNLEIKEAQLIVVKDIIKICNDRNKY